jgi:hypothetical protein
MSVLMLRAIRPRAVSFGVLPPSAPPGHDYRRHRQQDSQVPPNSLSHISRAGSSTIGSGVGIWKRRHRGSFRDLI